MEAYDLPETSGLTPEQAGQALNKVYAAARSNPEHPFCSGKHPQAGDFTAVVKTLHELKCGKDAHKTHSPLTDGMEKGLAIKENRDIETQQARIKTAQGYVDRLDELNYSVGQPEHNINQRRIDCLELSVAVAEKDFDKAKTLMRPIMREQNISLETQEAYGRFFNSEGLNPQLQQDLAFSIIAHLNKDDD